MADEVIAPLSEEWMIPSDLENRVAGWERSAGVRLEASYRSFLMSYNGGRPYPNVFDVAIPENIWGSSDRQTFLDQLAAYLWPHKFDPLQSGARCMCCQ